LETDPSVCGLDDLLDGLDGDARAGRKRLVAELLERGYAPATLRDAEAQDRLAILLLEEAFGESASLTARQVAKSCGLDVDDVLRTFRLLGVPVADADTPALDDLSCATLQTMQLARAYGISQRGIDELLAVLGRRMWQLAADLEVIIGNELGRAGDTEYELAHRYADAASVLAPAAVPLVAGAFTAHLRERMREIFVTPAEAERGALRAVAEVTVAFVDVVGFTELGERVDADHLKSVASRLVDIAEAVLNPPVRLVKTLGDALLLMSRDTTALVDAVVEINTAAGVDPELPVHCGVAHGPAHVGGADVYGATVNLASRLTDLAPPHQIWASTATAALDTNLRHHWQSLGHRAVKGCADPIEIVELQTACPPRKEGRDDQRLSQGS
jgi:adenylate cyclase